ncbi:MAG TPA: hypothetical protein VFZ52_12120 [Chryseolinea sp.]
METIVFEGRGPKAADPLQANQQDDNNLTLDDIITIDSQIELKVRGELPEVKILNSATQFMEQKMMAYLEHAFEEFRLPKQDILDGTINFDQGPSSPAFEELRKFHLKKFAEVAELKTRSHRKNKFLFSIQPGFEIIIPPYDTEWTNSFGSYSAANKVSGSLKTFPLGDGYGASGVGVFLSSASDIWVRFSAHCPVSYSWANFISEGGGYAASRGGLGITIFDASAGVLIKDETETLWNQAGRPSDMEISGGGDELYVQNTSIGENHFKMRAGHAYLIWLWCWAFADSGPNAAAYANMDCKVPFMIVDSSSL